MSKKNQKTLNEIQAELNAKVKRRDQLIKEQSFLEKNEKRRERTRRLVETGALVEKHFDLTHLNMSEREEVFKTFAPFIKQNMPKKFKKKE